MHIPVILLLDIIDPLETFEHIKERAYNALKEDIDYANEDLMNNNKHFCNPNDCLGKYNECEKKDASCTSIAGDYSWLIGGRYSGMLKTKIEPKDLLPSKYYNHEIIESRMNEIIANPTICANNSDGRPDGVFKDDIIITREPFFEWYIKDGILMWSEEDGKIGFDEGERCRIVDENSFMKKDYIGNTWAIVIDYVRP